MCRGGGIGGGDGQRTSRHPGGGGGGARGQTLAGEGRAGAGGCCGLKG